ncbi:integrin beta-3-like [Clavelina lepadiformis]|uniref:integrin beta-3-like n=1 Tax=Clavelina lepadiformis TaxID=159417 RepID=UPI004042D15C
MKEYILCCFLMCSLSLVVKGANNACTESKAKSCGECIALPGCAWCQAADYADNPNVVISRCDLPENLLSEKCPPEAISNPQSKSVPGQNNELSNVGESEVGKATQMKPQTMDVYLRPGDPVNINLAFKQAEDYPVDLYYLLDLSKSMEDDLEKLRKLGQQLGQKMQEITRDFRLGFGSFIDKTVSPYISTVPARLRNPCDDLSPCQPTYSFHNDLPLTPKIESFVTSVNNVTHSSNLDNPEGGLDAMMQAIVCQQSIKWRKDATHLLVYSTDASFHYAGDGKLGGIVFPNDGKCYLSNDGNYFKANEMDYPSIGHLVKKITDHNIQPIFAVTSTVIKTYKNLQKMIPKSVTGELSGDSSNIIDLIQNAYNDLKGQVILEVKGPKEIKVSEQMAHCQNSTMEGLKCDGVKLGDVVNFTFTLSVDTCLPEPVELYVTPYGYNDRVNITVTSLCDCQCNETEAAHNCSGHGKYECGACVCDPGFTGIDCFCDQKDLKGVESYLINCTDPVTGVVCSDRGECQCGQCLCMQEFEKKIDGKYCECDNTTCDRVSGKICNNLGTCNCGNCECNDGWKGKACECTLDTSECFDTSSDAIDSTQPCNGNGECECGVCSCFSGQGGAKFRGQYCQTKPIVICDIHRDCIQCKAFHTGNYNDAECEKNCQNYNVTILGDEASDYDQDCRFTDQTDDCSFQVYFSEKNGTIYVDVEPEKICAAYANPMYIIIGIIAAIVGIGLAILLIWKLLTSIKDAREFKNFQKESQNPKWEGGENPIFKKATSTFRNPMYTGGKPSANL